MKRVSHINCVPPFPILQSTIIPVYVSSKSVQHQRGAVSCSEDSLCICYKLQTTSINILSLLYSISACRLRPSSVLTCSPLQWRTPCVFSVGEQQLRSVRTLLVVLAAHHILL